MAYKQDILIFHSSGGCKAEIKAPADSVSGEGLFFIDGILSLCPHMVEWVREIHEVWSLFFFGGPGGVSRGMRDLSSLTRD